MGKLTTHILDTARGCPGAGIGIRLFRLDGSRELLCEITSNADGRSDEPLLSGEDFRPGRYELEFAVGAYFQKAGISQPEPAFLDDVVLRFGLGADEHYHVPLLVSPWSYSTYRGS